MSNRGVLRAARDYIQLRAELTGRKPISVGLGPDLYQRFASACEELGKAAGILDANTVQAPDCTFTYYGVDFFPSPNGIEAF